MNNAAPSDLVIRSFSMHGNGAMPGGGVESHGAALLGTVFTGRRALPTTRVGFISYGARAQAKCAW